MDNEIQVLLTLLAFVREKKSLVLIFTVAVVPPVFSAAKTTNPLLSVYACQVFEMHNDMQCKALKSK